MLNILYEDDHILVVNKPEELLSVAGRGPDNQDSVHTRAQQLYSQVLVVHRLDCSTSGVMVLARTKAAHSELNRQFRERETHKEYQAITWGNCPLAMGEEGEIDFPLITDWPNRPLQKICYQDGKPSLTRYRLLEKKGLRNRLQLIPITGRSHQLRVHCMALGMPIVGDRFYAPQPVIDMSPRLLLHARRLSFTHPASGTSISFTAPLPF